MNLLDIIVTVFICFFVAVGFKRGFVKEVQSLGIWIVSGMVAWLFAAEVGRVFSSTIASPQMRSLAGFAVLFIIIFMFGKFLMNTLNKQFKGNAWTRLPNTILGAAMGGARGLYIVTMVVMVVGLTGVPKFSWWQQSLFAPTLGEIALAASAFLPRDVSRHISYN